MTKLQKIIGLAAAFVLMVGLSACGLQGSYTGPEVAEFTVTLSDGTVVPCFKVKDIYGANCNFDKAVRSNVPKP